MWDFGERFKDRQNQKLKTRRACFALFIKWEGRHNTLEYAIQLKNVTKTFGKVVANKNVNLDVKKVRSSPFWEKTEVVRPLL